MPCRTKGSTLAVELLDKLGDSCIDSARAENARFTSEIMPACSRAAFTCQRDRPLVSGMEVRDSWFSDVGWPPFRQRFHWPRLPRMLSLTRQAGVEEPMALGACWGPPDPVRGVARL